MADGQLINLATLCRLLGISRNTLYQWLFSEQFPAAAKVISGRRYWTREQVCNFLKGKNNGTG